MKKALQRKNAVFSFIIITLLLGALYFSASANDGPSKEFIDLCDDLFNGNNQTAVETLTGTDITQSFCDAYEQSYKAGEYGVLWDAVLENEYVITSIFSAPTMLQD